MASFKIRVTRKTEEHVEIAVFVAPHSDATYVNTGALTMRPMEYEAFASALWCGHGDRRSGQHVEFFGDLHFVASQPFPLLPWHIVIASRTNAQAEASQ